jgi:hypothetical protein
MFAPVHQQRTLGVDHRPVAEKSLHTAGVRFDEDNIVRQRGREPSRGILA